MASLAFPSPDSYGQNVPAQSSPASAAQKRPSAGGDFTNTLLLADLALYSKPDDIRDCAGRLIERAETIDDANLRRMVVFSLSKVVNNPENAKLIRAEHLTKVGNYFFQVAQDARQGNRNDDALAAVQIALHCAPAHAEARLLFASLIEPKAALQTLHYGIQFLNLETEIAPVYFNRYFSALADLQQDRIAAKQALAILGEKIVPPAVRTAVAGHAAMALFWIGEYNAALKVLDDEKLAETQQGMILKSRCLFELRRSREAIALLNEKINAFPSSKRDVILSQLSHFHQYLGEHTAALEVANRRIQENPTNAQPYLQRLYLLKKIGNTETFDAELKNIFETFSAQQSALISLANFAAENGNPEIAENCAGLALKAQMPQNIFVAALIEAHVTAGSPERAIELYRRISQSSSGTNNILEGVESATTAILAAAYAQTAAQTTDAEKQKTLRGHADLLLSQFLADDTLSPENYISVTALFRRIQQPEAALKIAQAGLDAFPWHSQLRANVIELRLQQNLIAGSQKQTPITKEIRVLANMRRPHAKIWKSIAAWLNTAPALPPQEIAVLKQVVTPLVRDDLHFDDFSLRQ